MLVALINFCYKKSRKLKTLYAIMQKGFIYILNSLFKNKDIYIIFKVFTSNSDKILQCPRLMFFLVNPANNTRSSNSTS